MKTASTFHLKTNVIWYPLVILASSGLLGVIISMSLTDNIVLLLILLFFALSILFIAKPTWLFYLFMLFFVFSEVSVGQYSIQPSLSNGFSILAIGIIIFYGVFGKRFYALVQSPQQRNLFLGLIIILIIEIISGIINNSLRPIATRLSNLITLLFFLLIVRDRETLMRGLFLGVISVGMLSILTILASLNLNPLGYRAPVSWDSTPWENYIHRAIGLPNMQGGLHSIYILAFLPLAILLVTNGKRLKINLGIQIISAITVVLGILALLIASYRSGWIGLMGSLFCLLWFYNRFLRLSNTGKSLSIFFMVGIIILLIFPFSAAVYTYIYNLIFNIRSQGIDARLIQYQFVYDRMLSPSIHQVFGFGYDDFAVSFMAYVGQQGLTNPELYPWIHNYYFGLLYASGLLGFTSFLLYLFYIMRNLYRQAASADNFIRILGTAIFASLIGIFSVLLFTAETSGLHIVWILIAASAFVYKIGINPFYQKNKILQ